jgi:hypothetical protein
MSLGDRTDHFLNAAAGLESEPQLALGISDKLRVAINGNPLLLPTASVPVVGKQLRLLAGLSALSEVEAQVFSTWVEEKYGAATLARFETPIQGSSHSQGQPG